MRVSHERLVSRQGAGAGSERAPPPAGMGAPLGPAEAHPGALQPAVEEAARSAARRRVMDGLTHKSALCPHRVLVRRGDHLWGLDQGGRQGKPGRMSLQADSCVHVVCERGARLWGQWELAAGSGGTLSRADCRLVSVHPLPCTSSSLPDLEGSSCLCVAGGPWVLDRCCISLLSLAPPPVSADRTGSGTKASAAAGPMAAAAPAASGQGPYSHFMPAMQFTGRMDGWCFKRGYLGLGYYWDGPLQDAPATLPLAPPGAPQSAGGDASCGWPALRPSSIDYFLALSERARSMECGEGRQGEQEAGASTSGAWNENGQDERVAGLDASGAGAGWRRAAAMVVTAAGEVVVYRSEVSGGVVLRDECEVLMEDCHIADTGSCLCEGACTPSAHGDGISFDGSAAGLLRRCLLTNNSRACVGICGEGPVKAVLEMCEFAGNAGSILHADYAQERPRRIRPCSLAVRRCIIRDGLSLWRGDRYAPWRALAPPA
jgi:hypothetical protein